MKETITKERFKITLKDISCIQGDFVLISIGVICQLYSELIHIYPL